MNCDFDFKLSGRVSVIRWM